MMEKKIYVTPVCVAIAVETQEMLAESNPTIEVNNEAKGNLEGRANRDNLFDLWGNDF